MTDRRLHPPADQVTRDEPARISVPIIDLTRGPGGARDRQLLFGDAVRVLNREGDFALVRADKDGYCGTLPATALASPIAATHKVTARLTHAYAAPDFKSPDLMALPFAARLAARSETPTFIETDCGFVPRQHVHPLDTHATDPAAVAAVFLGTPYLWGGNSHLGIDCSGLVQAACLACGLPCPGDSDQQADGLGADLPEDAALRRNDLIFWKGHVAMVSDDTTLIHANAGHMAVVHEPIRDAITRIETQGDGLPTRRKRLSLTAA